MQKKKDLNYKQELSHSRLRKPLLLVLLLGLGLLIVRGLLLVLVLGVLLGVLLVLLLGLLRWLLLVLWGEQKLTNRYRQKSKTQLPQWIYRFLEDEEKTAILLDYRI
ncbi:MAG: hypothetical protein AAF652_14375, partial [Cyanobacteria bacterium P01_C01_bin.72]